MDVKFFYVAESSMIFPIIGDIKKLLHISTHDAMHAINLKKCLKCTSDTVELPNSDKGNSTPIPIPIKAILLQFQFR